MNVTKLNYAILHHGNADLYRKGRFAVFMDFSDAFALHPTVRPFPPHEKELTETVAKRVGDALGKPLLNGVDERIARFNAERANKETKLSDEGMYLLWAEALNGLLKTEDFSTLVSGWKVNENAMNTLRILREMSGIGNTQWMPVTFTSRTQTQLIAAFLKKMGAEVTGNRSCVYMKEHIIFDIDAVEFVMPEGVFNGQITPISKYAKNGAFFCPRSSFVIGDNQMVKWYEDAWLLNTEDWDESVVRRKIENRLKLFGSLN